MDKYLVVEGEDSMDGNKAISSLLNGLEGIKEKQNTLGQQYQDAVKRQKVANDEWNKKYLQEDK